MGHLHTARFVFPFTWTHIIPPLLGQRFHPFILALQHLAYDPAAEQVLGKC